MKLIFNKEDMREKIKEGMKEIAAPVKRTLGPGGNSILIERVGQSLDGTPLAPKITKDGVSVANECASIDPGKDLVIQSVKAICKKTNTVAGDGPQPYHSKILTPTGWTTMQNIKVGMRICGTDGSTQSVLGVFPKGEKDVYEVCFSDGRVVECCEEHLWTVTVASNNRPKKTLTTKQMLADFKTTNTNGDFRYKYFIPNSIVEMEDFEKEMPLDPYLVGVLLGDGSLTGSGSIEISIGVNKRHIIDKILLPDGFKLSVQEINSRNAIRLKISGTNSNNETMHRVVESMGLLGVSSKTKFIPKSYLYASITTRKALLQGLLDTDGHINNRGLFEFTTVSDILCNDFKELAWSLGIPLHYKLHTREADKQSYSNTPIHRITQLQGYMDGHKIVDIRPTGTQVEMQCIKVSNEDHLYITDGFIPTHNTTTAIVLGESILNETLKVLDEDSSLNPQLVKEDIDRVIVGVMQELKDKAIPVNSNNIIKQVATISANGDQEIGDMLGEAFDRVGAEGVITIDEGHTAKVTLEIVEGYQFSRGAEAQDRFFNNKEQTYFEAENAAILFYDGKLLNYTDLIPALQKLAGLENGQPTKKLPPVVIMANEFSTEVIQFLLIQRIEMGLTFCAVRGPHTTNVRTGYYDDLAVMTGGSRLGNGSRNITAFEDGDEGLVNRIIIDKYKTTIYGGQGTEEDILDRVDQLRALRDLAESPYDAQVVSDRIAALAGGIAKIGVGGSTDFEIKEKYDRMEDALNAARAAIAEGIVPGGGATLFRIAKRMSEVENPTVGQRILQKALQAPLRQIMENIGVTLTDEIIKQILASETSIYDARGKIVVDALEAGIIDPVKVTRSALENAISIATLLSCAGGGITYIRK